MSVRSVDLAKYQSGGARIFAGRDRGAFVRDAAALVEFERNKEDILEVLIPTETYAVTSSFFLGLFGETIRALGADEFRRRVRFVGKPITRVVEQAIWEAIEATKPFSLA